MKLLFRYASWSGLPCLMTTALFLKICFKLTHKVMSLIDFFPSTSPSAQPYLKTAFFILMIFLVL